MDFTHIVQGKRQFFQGNPSAEHVDEIRTCGNFKSQEPASLSSGKEGWLSKTTKSVVIPPEIEARYSHVNRSNGKQQSIGKQNINNGNSDILISSKVPTITWNGEKYKPNCYVDTPLDLSVRPVSHCSVHMTQYPVMQQPSPAVWAHLANQQTRKGDFYITPNITHLQADSEFKTIQPSESKPERHGVLDMPAENNHKFYQSRESKSQHYMVTSIQYSGCIQQAADSNLQSTSLGLQSQQPIGVQTLQLGNINTELNDKSREQLDTRLQPVSCVSVEQSFKTVRHEEYKIQGGSAMGATQRGLSQYSEFNLPNISVANTNSTSFCDAHSVEPTSLGRRCVTGDHSYNQNPAYVQNYFQECSTNGRSNLAIQQQLPGDVSRQRFLPSYNPMTSQHQKVEAGHSFVAKQQLSFPTNQHIVRQQDMLAQNTPHRLTSSSSKPPFSNDKLQYYYAQHPVELNGLQNNLRRTQNDLHLVQQVVKSPDIKQQTHYNDQKRYLNEKPVDIVHPQQTPDLSKQLYHNQHNCNSSAVVSNVGYSHQTFPPKHLSIIKSSQSNFSDGTSVRQVPVATAQRLPPVATVSATVRTSVSVSSSASSKVPAGFSETVGNGNKIVRESNLPRSFPWLQQRSNNLKCIKQTVIGSTQQQKPVGVALVSFKNAHEQSYKEIVKPSLNLATHPFPHLAAAAAAATAAKATPFKFRTKAELKQMNLTTPNDSVSLATIPHEKQVVEPIIADDKWQEWSTSFQREWETFVKDLTESDNIKRICRVTKPDQKKGKRGRPKGEQPFSKTSNSTIKTLKKVEDYSSDEDIPLSLRQKIMHDRQRTERLKRRKRKLNSEDSCYNSDVNDTIVDRIRKRRVAVLERNASNVLPTSSTKSNKEADGIYPGWEGEVVNFKKQLRMPIKLINISRPRDSTVSHSAEALDTTTTHTFHHKIYRKTKHVRCNNSSSASASAIKWSSNQYLPFPSSFTLAKRWNCRIFRHSLLLTQQYLLNSKLQKFRKQIKCIKKPRRAKVETISHKPKTELKPEIRLRIRIIRRRFRSGFDYIRKKKKNRGEKESNFRRPKAPVKAYHVLGSSLDAATEIRSWVVNKSLGESTLHRAARLGYLEGVEYLLQRPETNVSAKDNAGYTPLHEACTKGHLLVAKMLLQYGASESCSAKGGIRPLHEATENDHLEVVRLLLSYGADPTLATYAGQTPLALCSSDSMKQFLTAYISDTRGVVSPWVFSGSSSLMDEPTTGFDVLDTSYIDDFYNEIAIYSSSSLAALEASLFQLVGKNNNPWLRLENVANIFNCDIHNLLNQLVDISRVTLTREEFMKTAVPLAKQRMKEEHFTDSIVLIHYNDRVKTILDIEQLSVSL